MNYSCDMRHLISHLTYGLVKATILVTLCLMFGLPAQANYESTVRGRSQSPWSARFDLSGSRGSDELDYYTVSGSATISYSPRPWHSAYLAGGFLRPTANEVENTHRYGATDTTAGYSIRRLGHFRNGIEIDGDLNLTFPTSTISNRASLQALLAPSLAVTYPLYRRTLFARSRHEVAYGFYRFETADDAGYHYNSPWMFTNGLGLGIRFQKTTSLLDYDFTHLIDYAGTRINVQTLRASFNVAFTGRASVAAFARWRDRVVTDNAVFDTDTRVIGLSLQYFL